MLTLRHTQIRPHDKHQLHFFIRAIEVGELRAVAFFFTVLFFSFGFVVFVRRVQVRFHVVAVRPAFFFFVAEEAEAAALADEVAGYAGEDGGRDHVGGCGGGGAVEVGHFGIDCSRGLGVEGGGLVEGSSGGFAERSWMLLGRR